MFHVKHFNLIYLKAKQIFNSTHYLSKTLYQLHKKQLKS